MIRGRMSFPFTESFLYTKGSRIIDAIPKRKKASVNGGMLSSDHLKIGAAAPQITFAIIRAKIAYLVLLIQKKCIRFDYSEGRGEFLQLFDCIYKKIIFNKHLLS